MTEDPSPNPIEQTGRSSDVPQTVETMAYTNSEQRPASPLDSRHSGFLLAVVFEGMLCVIAVVVGYFVRVPTWSTIHWNVSGLSLGVWTGCFLFCFFYWTTVSKWRPLARIRRILDEMLIPMFGRCSIVELALISLCAGFGEELLFRGLIQNLFDRWFGWQIAIVVASLLFGIAHMVTLAYFVAATVLGFIFGMMWIATDNLLAPIIAHALYDFLALLYYLRLKPRFA